MRARRLFALSTLVVFFFWLAAARHLWLLLDFRARAQVGSPELARFATFLEEAKKRIPAGSSVKIVLPEDFQHERHTYSRAQFILTGRIMQTSSNGGDADYLIVWRSSSVSERFTEVWKSGEGVLGVRRP